MQAVVLVDAAPGYEEGVEASLQSLPGVVKVARIKHKNYDVVVLLEMPDASRLNRFMSNDLRMITGVRAVERLESPSADLMKRLTG